MKILTALLFILFSVSTFGALSPDTPDIKMGRGEVNVRPPLIECQDGNCDTQVLGGANKDDLELVNWHKGQIWGSEKGARSAGVVEEKKGN